ncbi:MurR/RpiR family transcriptional regulator [Sulfitobacter sp. S0837]|uniref:MurR/RpiR family transcriptional regulator n=1 Tax=Sulfitobacter maritimus TaxID=2741719 RepID=UPI001582F9E4|nr:MurR/RpiR family transcriptional regulator [Sulfitobacter maritimus]NUH65169.1 MurR/RpiR family transcriptional regulator [Sulfitobacter maritimus]
MSLKEFHAKLMATMPSLPAKAQRGGRYVLDHPDDVVIYSMREIAERAAVSPATLVRLANLLGFERWSDIRLIHSEHLRSVPEPYVDRASNVVGSSGRNLVQEAFSAHRANLSHTEAINGSTAICAAAEKLARADRVFVAAFMSCRAPGHTFVYLSRMLRDDVVLLDASTLPSELLSLRPDDAVLSINFQPYGREIEQVAYAVERSGASLVCLSDSRASPLTPLTDNVLLFGPSGPSFFPSITAASALVESLMTAMLVCLGEEGKNRIGAVEEELYRSGAYYNYHNTKEKTR